jgi:hypothetical protein
MTVANVLSVGHLTQSKNVEIIQMVASLGNGFSLWQALWELCAG